MGDGEEWEEGEGWERVGVGVGDGEGWEEDEGGKRERDGRG